MLIPAELVQSLTQWQPCWPHLQGTQRNAGSFNFIQSYHHYRTLVDWVFLSDKTEILSLHIFPTILLLLLHLISQEVFFFFSLHHGVLSWNRLFDATLYRFSEVYRIIPVSMPLHHINNTCLQNLTLGLTSCLLDNVILHYCFYQYI